MNAMPARKSPFLYPPNPLHSEYIRLTSQTAGWESLNFAARLMKGGETWRYETAENELALVVLGGICSVRSNRGDWLKIGRRSDVFQGMPYTLYLPRRTVFTVEALSQHLDLAYGWAATDEDHLPRLVPPEAVEIEIRGGDNFTRQINKMIPPGFDCHRLVVVEVYTPSGNWSSYPGHKHDRHRLDENGNLLEADLEEIYFYKIDRPQDGWAIQRVYNDDGSLDELVLARDSHLVVVPEGYHPVVAPPGYNIYYLNFLAGSAQSLMSQDDERYAWVKEAWSVKDTRLPLVSMEMEKE
jgi:5-deoxy-glucuronate isomerase